MANQEKKPWYLHILESGNQEDIIEQIQKSMWFYRDANYCRKKYLADAKWWYQYLNEENKAIIKEKLSESLYETLIKAINNSKIEPHLF